MSRSQQEQFRKITDYNLKSPGEKARFASDMFDEMLAAGKKALVLDCDGTILDCHTCHMDSVQQLFNTKEGVPFSGEIKEYVTKQQARDLFADAELFELIVRQAEARKVRLAIASKQSYVAIHSLMERAFGKEFVRVLEENGGIHGNPYVTGGFLEGELTDPGYKALARSLVPELDKQGEATGRFIQDKATIVTDLKGDGGDKSTFIREKLTEVGVQPHEVVYVDDAETHDVLLRGGKIKKGNRGYLQNIKVLVFGGSGQLEPIEAKHETKTADIKDFKGEKYGMKAGNLMKLRQEFQKLITKRFVYTMSPTLSVAGDEPLYQNAGVVSAASAAVVANAPRHYVNTSAAAVAASSSISTTGNGRVLRKAPPPPSRASGDARFEVVSSGDGMGGTHDLVVPVARVPLVVAAASDPRYGSSSDKGGVKEGFSNGAAENAAAVAAGNAKGAEVRSGAVGMKSILTRGAKKDEAKKVAFETTAAAPVHYANLPGPASTEVAPAAPRVLSDDATFPYTMVKHDQRRTEARKEEQKADARAKMSEFFDSIKSLAAPSEDGAKLTFAKPYKVEGFIEGGKSKDITLEFVAFSGDAMTVSYYNIIGGEKALVEITLEHLASSEISSGKNLFDAMVKQVKPSAVQRVARVEVAGDYDEPVTEVGSYTAARPKNPYSLAEEPEERGGEDADLPATTKFVAAPPPAAPRDVTVLMPPAAAHDPSEVVARGDNKGSILERLKAALAKGVEKGKCSESKNRFVNRQNRNYVFDGGLAINFSVEIGVKKGIFGRRVDKMVEDSITIDKISLNGNEVTINTKKPKGGSLTIDLSGVGGVKTEGEKMIEAIIAEIDKKVKENPFASVQRTNPLFNPEPEKGGVVVEKDYDVSSGVKEFLLQFELATKIATVALNLQDACNRLAKGNFEVVNGHHVPVFSKELSFATKSGSSFTIATLKGAETEHPYLIINLKTKEGLEPFDTRYEIPIGGSTSVGRVRIVDLQVGQGIPGVGKAGKLEGANDLELLEILTSLQERVAELEAGASRAAPPSGAAGAVGAEPLVGGARQQGTTLA